MFTTTTTTKGSKSIFETKNSVLNRKFRETFEAQNSFPDKIGWSVLEKNEWDIFNVAVSKSGVTYF